MHWFKTTTTQKIAKAVLVLSALVLVCYGFRPTSEINAAAGINKQLNYQGKLMTKTSGVQVSDTSWNFKFEIWNASSLLWTERWTSTTTQVTTVNGIFSVPLGSLGQTDNLSDIDWNTDELYLKVTLDADANGSWEESFTNKRITSSAYAFNADEIDGLHATSTAAVANYLLSLDSAANLNLLGKGVSSTVATTTEFLNVGTGTGANVTHLDRSGGDLYVADDVEIDSDLSVAGNATTTGAQNASYYTGSGEELTLAYTAGSDLKNLQNFFNLYSAGIRTGGVMTDAGGGKINISAGEGTIAIGSLSTDPLTFMSFAASSSIDMVNSINYLGIDYNAGSPKIVLHAANDWTYQDTFPLGRVVNESGTLHISQNGRTIADTPGLLERRFHQTLPYARDELVGGLILGETGTRNITVSTGVLWDRANSWTIPAFSSAGAGRFDAYYRDGGSGFTRIANQSQWPNTQYDDGSGTLANLGANKYANLWWYLEIDGGVVMLYGRNSYNTAADASKATPPATIPDRLSFGAKLIARTTFKTSDSTFTANDSVFNNTFSATAVSSHSNLSNLDYASAGHTGFAGLDVFNVFTAGNSFTTASFTSATTSSRLVVSTVNPTNNFGKIWIGGDLYNSGNATTTNTLQVSGALATGTARPNSTTTANFGGNILVQGAATTTGRLVVSTSNPTNDFGKIWVGGDLYNSGNATTTGSTYLGATAGLNSVYINNWSDLNALISASHWSTNASGWLTTTSSEDIYIDGNATTTGKLVTGTSTPSGNFGIYSNAPIVSGTGLGGTLTALNPANQASSISLGWLNDIPRLRYGGTGAGATGGFQIQGAGDAVKFSVDDSGNATTTGRLTVGTTNPTSNSNIFTTAGSGFIGLHTYVSSDSAVSGIKVENAGTGTSARSQLQVTNSGESGYLAVTDDAYTAVAGWDDVFLIASDSSVDGGVVLYSNDKIRLQNTAGTDAVTLTGSNLGIGTNSPDAKLDVVGGNIYQQGVGGILGFLTDGGIASYAINKSSSNAYLQLNDSLGAAKVYLFAGGNSYLTGGNLGISDASPAQLLTVGDGEKFTVDSLGNATSTGKLVVGSENPTVASYLISADDASGAPYTDGSYTIFGEIGESTAIARGGIGYHPNSGSSYGVYGEVDTSNTGNGVAVYGKGQSTNYGALGYNTGAAYGVYGYFDAIHYGYIGSALYGGYFNGGLYSNGSATTTGFLSVGVGTANDDDYIFFDTGMAEYLSWDDNPGEFDLSDDLNITGSATTSGSFQATGGLATGTARPNSTTTANLGGNIYIQGRATTTGNLTVGTTGYQSARNTGVLSNLYYNGTAAASGMDFYTFVDNDTPSYIRGIAGLAALVNSTVAGGFTMEAAHAGITLNSDTISGGTSNLVGYHTDDTITSLTVSGSPIINMIGFESSLNQDLSQTGTVTKYGVKVDTAGLADTNYGIYASASGAGTNYAGYFAGDIVVTGSGSKFTSLPASDGFANYVCVGLDGTLYQQSGTVCGGAAHIMEKIAAATSSLDLMPGEVVVVDPDKDESVARSTKAYDPSVVGIISTSDNGFIIGGYGNVYITLAGRLKAKVSGENGPIRRGDPITTSNTPGHGMLATKSNVGVYAVALEPFDPETASSTGEVLALARTGYSMPQSAQTPTAPADGQADDLLVSQNDFSSVTLAVQQEATFYGTITVIGEAGFEHNVVFKKDVEIQGKLYVSSDQAGTIKLSANATSTEVLFAGEYQTIPKIVATLNSLADVKFAITEKSTKSFRLAVLEPKGEELSFDWIAMPTKTPSQMPVITDLIFTKNQATAGDAVELWAKVTDPDNADAELKYTWNFSPSNGAIDGNTGLVYWTVDDVNQDTEVTITVTVFDGYNTVSQSKAVTVVKKGIATDQPTDTTAPTENPQNATSTPAIVSGCMNNLATNYNSLATQDDGSCLLASNPPTEPATTTPAVTQPPSQEPTIVLGCMNNLATNYNPLATQDDGSCQLASNAPPEEPPNPPAPPIAENDPSTPQPASDSGTGGGQIPDSTD